MVTITTPTARLSPNRFLTGLGPTALATGMAGAAVARGWRGVDWPAQIYRVQLFRHHGLIGFDGGWYGGHYPIAYSALFPPLAATIGAGVVAIASAGVAAWAFDRLVVGHFGSRARIGSFVFAAGTLVQVAVGRLPFLLGVMFALLALLANRSRRSWLAVLAAVACAATSGVAAAFLALAGVAWALAAGPGERWRPLVLAAAAGLPVAAITLLYREPGSFPFRAGGLALLLGSCAVAAVVLPTRERALRIGALLYALAALVVFVVPSAMGGNMTRLATTVGMPVVLCATLHARRLLGAALTVPFLVWQWTPAVGVFTSSAGDTSSHEAYFTPLLAEVGRLDSGPARIEIPFTRDHWEAAWVAPTVPLARGWERQLDVATNPLFYQSQPITPTQYQSWLLDNGIRWVALPDVPLDYSARAESALLRAGAPFLRPVWGDAHWRLWQVVGSPGLVSGPARLTSLTADRFGLQFDQPASVVVRVRYSPTWSVDGGGACVAPAPGGWTRVTADRSGAVAIAAGLLPRSSSAC